MKNVKPRQDIHEGIEASRKGDVRRLKSWLQDGNNPNVHDFSGWTPLLWAAVRGHYEAVALLLDNEYTKADITLPHRESSALAIHMAGHSGNVQTATIILDHLPDHLNAVWDLNGHTVLLQSVFYGHLDLARILLQKGAETFITTARGLGPMELSIQFQNKAMTDLIRPFDSTSEAKASYYQTYLKKIAPIVPPEERVEQALADQVVSAIEEGIRKAMKAPDTMWETLATVRDLVENKKADVNRLGGVLQQPPLIVTVTGNNGLPAVPAVAELRLRLAEYLLARGADPTLHERHPMGAQTIIRAAVFNHLDILKMCARFLTPEKHTEAINEIPVVNGLTAMHDTVLRATMAAPDRFEGYLEQARWFVENGGRSDIEDFSGITQRNIAERAKNPGARKRLLDVLDGKS